MSIAHIKQPSTRPMIVAEVTRALSHAVRPLTLSDLYDMCESAETKEDLARVLSHMKSEGTIENGDDVQPGEPCGMAHGKGARAVASYRLATNPVDEALKIELSGTNIGDAGITSYIDNASDSHNGDEFASPTEWEPDVARQLDDLHCSRFDKSYDWVNIVSRMDDALMSYADRMMGDDPVWQQLRAVRQAMTEVL